MMNFCLQQSEETFSEKRKKIQAELEKKEKEEKHNRWMEMLRHKDPKRYKAELEKDRKREEEREAKRKEEEERIQKKLREAKEREPKTLDPIRDLVSQAIENVDSQEKMREIIGQINSTIGAAKEYIKQHAEEKRLQMEEDNKKGIKSRDTVKNVDENEFNTQAGTSVVDAVLSSCSYINYHEVAQLWNFLNGDSL